uniref:DUF1764 domain-containing protein n=1 Tax=Calcidiscus leptoporus TaxID=127549 RepID=A0A7S0P5U4_9EUKA|mmetsp:Transcript_60224/g.138163  ORF Transcript_60224/g.138163 Transcript_60224/m.138163 type:complete len:156 (+) Transcript_60224:103-570(+)
MKFRRASDDAKHVGNGTGNNKSKRKKVEKRARPLQGSSKEAEAKGVVKASHARAGAAELDDIFGSLGAKRKAAKAAAADAAGSEGSKRKATPKRQVSVDPIFGEEYDLDRVIDPQNAKVHRHDAATGLRVFKAHALGLGQGGGTPLCPFDCKCCY